MAPSHGYYLYGSRAFAATGEALITNFQGASALCQNCWFVASLPAASGRAQLPETMAPEMIHALLNDPAFALPPGVIPDFNTTDTLAVYVVPVVIMGLGSYLGGFARIDFHLTGRDPRTGLGGL